MILTLAVQTLDMVHVPPALAYSNLSSVVGGWNAVNPTKRNVLTFDSTRDIKFDPPPNEINENDVQAVVRAAVARAMTSRKVHAAHRTRPTLV